MDSEHLELSHYENDEYVSIFHLRHGPRMSVPCTIELVVNTYSIEFYLFHLLDRVKWVSAGPRNASLVQSSF